MEKDGLVVAVPEVEVAAVDVAEAGLQRKYVKQKGVKGMMTPLSNFMGSFVCFFVTPLALLSTCFDFVHG